MRKANRTALLIAFALFIMLWIFDGLFFSKFTDKAAAENVVEEEQVVEVDKSTYKVIGQAHIICEDSDYSIDFTDCNVYGTSYSSANNDVCVILKDGKNRIAQLMNRQVLIFNDNGDLIEMVNGDYSLSIEYYDLPEDSKDVERENDTQ